MNPMSSAVDDYDLWDLVACWTQALDMYLSNCDGLCLARGATAVVDNPKSFFVLFGHQACSPCKAFLAVLAAVQQLYPPLFLLLALMPALMPFPRLYEEARIHAALQHEHRQRVS